MGLRRFHLAPRLDHVVLAVPNSPLDPLPQIFSARTAPMRRCKAERFGGRRTSPPTTGEAAYAFSERMLVRFRYRFGLSRPGWTSLNGAGGPWVESHTL